MDERTKLLIDFDSGEASSQKLVDWAIHQMENGKEGKYLNQLAWISNPGYSETRDLFIKAGEELGFEFPYIENHKLLLAKIFAVKIVNGSKDFNEGCSEIAQICRELDSPELISVFVLLAHEQYDHDQI